jgi:hypothetical protein
MIITRRSALTAAGALAGTAMLADFAQAQERHPEIRNAIRALERARDYMQHAAHDFGGHRAEALEDCNRAIRQLQLALQFDKK